VVIERSFRPARPIDLRLTLNSLRRGHYDRAFVLDRDAFWRATRTPDGPASMRLQASRGEITVTAWGSGAHYVVDGASEMLGAGDDAAGFVPVHEILRSLHLRMTGLRLLRTRAVVEALIPTILEQKVTGTEAHRSYNALLAATGEPAPGPMRLIVPPEPERLAAMPYHEFHEFGIERRRAETIRVVCSYARRLEEAAFMPPAEARRRVMAVPGVGRWSAAEVARIAWGDADAVSLGDYHLPNLVAWTLAREPRGDDARMLQLLEPYRGQRGRAQRLLELSGITAPRYGPRLAPRSIASI
jgi:3-methyladenine DNA glycosylase/8-oxoguanine DNA glycosylase